jgi:hypothetical protein
VSVSNFVFVSLEQAKVTLTIDSGVALGSRTIAVTSTSPRTVIFGMRRSRKA